MKKLILIVCVGILLMSFSGAVKICIDNTAPSAPSNLRVSGNTGNILLTWLPATDKPNCSGIEKYIISRDGVHIGEVGANILHFRDLDSLSSGDYSYTVYAVDIVGHNTGSAIINTVSIVGNTVISSGGYGRPICYENWSCGAWSECVNGGQMRLCNDLNKCGPENQKPKVSRKCSDNGVVYNTITNTSTQKPIIHQNDNNNFLSMLTGAITGTMGKISRITIMFLIGFILLILIMFIGIVLRKKFKKQ